VHGSALADLPPEVLAARRRAKEETQARRAQREVKPVVLPPAADGLHRIAQRMLAKFEKAKQGSDGFVRIAGNAIFSVAVSPTATARVVLVADRLANEVERRGYSPPAQSPCEAAERLGLGLRQLKRLVQGWRRAGDAGLVNRQRGRAPLAEQA
jgi:hypothetical protein